ncbi:hypothetical protein Bca52824_092664 [Brassica carinata]|uniref:Calcineurin-like phosphoesterase domain-containing protein n=1 Tax=Brassica carinata TaxID=52824 RepID=A0A8X7NRW4_BRACI|nr:hypothetical protein Bca52824_092664 [Brassica carinata]
MRNSDGKITKVAIVTDPHSWTRHRFVCHQRRFLWRLHGSTPDVNMRRSFFQSVLPFKPEAVLFLGDYFDGGPFPPEEEWYESLSRFKHVFGLNSQGNVKDIPTFYIPGNPMMESSKGIGIRDAKSNPNVLLTHIPLYRPDQTPCGPHRASSVINQRLWRHFQDQEVNVSELHHYGIIKEVIRVDQTCKLKLSSVVFYSCESSISTLVLSGHDHDQCTLTHKSEAGFVTEHTLGTVSWYLSLLVLTILALLLWPNHGISFLNNAAECVSGVMKLSFLSGVTKEKNEDENYEYEMVWDAEWSMHLVKKVLQAPVKRQSDKALLERGNAVMRSAARKNASEEIQVVRDSNVGVGVSDPVMRSASKSRTKLVIQRVIRTIMMSIVIAAFNVPIYMMLFFKDWIEKK